MPRSRTNVIRAAINLVRQHGWAGLLYGLITLLYTYPLVLHPRSAIIGQIDALENYWNLWWTREAVLQLRQNPWHVTWMHYPFELPLYFHTYDSVNALLSLPLQVLFGTTAAYNLLVLFAFWLAALGAYSLVWYLTQHQPAAFIAGLIYAFCPYMAFHADVGQPFMQMIGWLPLYLLALLKGLRGRRRWLVVAGCLLAIIAYTDWHLAVFSLTMTALVGITEIAQRGTPLPWGRRSVLVGAKLAAVGLLFTLLMLPLLVPMLREVLSDPYATRPLESSIQHSTDLLAYLLPSPFHPLWGAWAASIFYGHLVPVGILGGIASVGYVALALALAGLWGDRRRSALYLLIMIVGGVLALGPYLQVNGVNSVATAHRIPLPYLLFHRLPFMDVLRIPSRFVVLVMLGLAVLAGLGVRALWERRAIDRMRRAGQIVVLGGLTCLLLFEYWPHPFRVTATTPDQVSPFFLQLGKESANYALLEVPYREHRSLFAQTYHQKPTVGGRISRPKLHPWFNARFFGPLIRAASPTKELGAHSSPADWRAALSCQNIRYVIFYKAGIGAQQRAVLAALEKAVFVGVRPVYEDATLRAYGPVQEPTKEAYWTLDPAEWYDAETTPEGLTFRWLKSDKAGLTIDPCGQSRYTLQFQADAFAQARTLRVALNGQVVSTVHLPPDQLTTVRVPLSVHAGSNEVTLETAEPPLPASSRGAKNDARQLRISIGDVSVLP